MSDMTVTAFQTTEFEPEAFETPEDFHAFKAAQQALMDAVRKLRGEVREGRMFTIVHVTYVKRGCPADADREDRLLQAATDVREDVLERGKCLTEAITDARAKWNVGKTALVAAVQEDEYVFGPLPRARRGRRKLR